MTPIVIGAVFAIAAMAWVLAPIIREADAAEEAIRRARNNSAKDGYDPGKVSQ